MKRKIKIVMALVLLGALVGAALIVLFCFMCTVSYRGIIKGDVLDEVLIERDKRGMPLIRAGRLEDVYFALGYLHAQDRLLQIEYQRALARGRISEIIGLRGVMIDKLSRTVGFFQRAERIVGELSSPYREYLDAYVSGINRFRDTGENELLTGYLPEEAWKAVDVLSVLLFFEWSHSYESNHELLFPLPEGFEGPLWELVPEKLQYRYGKEDRENILFLKEMRKMLREFVGSYLNGFAVYLSGTRTKTGNSILFSSLDSGIGTYPLWYPVSVIVEPLSVNGCTIAGLPFIVVGKNNYISFCGFTLQADTQRFFREEVRELEGRMQYLSRGAWMDLAEIDEAVQIGRERGREVISFAVRSTERGPVISDLFRDRMKTDVISMQSLWPDASYIVSLFEIPLSASMENALNLVQRVSSAPRVYLFATDEEAEYCYSGMLPVKSFEREILSDGSWHLDRGQVDISTYRRRVDRENAIIGTAILEQEPSVIGEQVVYNDMNRYYRIKELIEQESVFDREAVQKILTDTYSVLAERFVPLYLIIMEKIPITSARLSRIYFHNWDLRMERDSVAASIFQTLMVRMLAETIGDELKDESSAFMESYYILLDNYYTLISEDRSLLFDDISTDKRVETRDMIFDRAFLKAMRFLNKAKGPIMEKWRWGGVHRGRYHLPLVDDSVIIDSFQELDEKEIRGGNSTIWKGALMPESMRPAEITALSIIMSEQEVSFASSYGLSLDPRSEYFSVFSGEHSFSSFTPSDENYILKIQPKE